MTILQAIQQVDELRPNTYSTRQKLLWLFRLETMVKTLVMDVHEGSEGRDLTGFTEHTDAGRELFMEAPFDVGYLYWLEAQIHYANEETGLYNNAMSMFNTVFSAFKAHYKQKHNTRSTGRFRF